MAWNPAATKMELQPESDDQPAIRPTQLIMHSIAAPWSGERIYEYWRDSTNLESHFGVAYDGGLYQYIGTQTRADANASANRRGDGTGAVSVETASNLEHTDPWTDEQVESLIALGVWMHQRHDLPLRICRSWTDPGYGYHGLYPEWSLGGTACPGDERIDQFNDVIFPGIVAAANGDPQPPKPDPGELEPFPGASFFRPGRRSQIVTEMGRRLVAEGCSAYSVGPSPDWGSADKRSYTKWQRKLGYSGSDADGIPGPTSWDRLRVPRT